MRVLIVCSANAGSISPFVADQAHQLKSRGLDLEVFPIRGKGFRGYLSNLPALRKKINRYRPDVLHAHSGMSALLAVLQRKVPVLVTFHGTDVNHPVLRRYSRLAMLLSARQVVVSAHMADLLDKPGMEVLPCGVDTSVFKPQDRNQALEHLGWAPDRIHLLFASSFSNPVKNYPLAQKAVAFCNDPRLMLHPLENADREQVVWMMNASHACLMSSVSEGSPQFIKEALACGTPIVTTDVGDVQQTIGNTDGCYICPPEPQQMAEALKKAIAFSETGRKTSGPERIREAGLEGTLIAGRLMEIYRLLSRK